MFLAQAGFASARSLGSRFRIGLGYMLGLRAREVAVVEVYGKSNYHDREIDPQSLTVSGLLASVL